MDVNLINRYISMPRFRRYLIASGNSFPKAWKLYNANMLLSQSLHPAVSIFEIFLRNALNEELIHHFSDQDWIINQRNGFMSVRRLQPRFQLKQQVNLAIYKLNRNGMAVSSSRLIADLSLGFWVSLFLKDHCILLNNVPLKVFPRSPHGTSRAQIYRKLNLIRSYRNRINHNEPVCFAGSSFSIDCSTVNQIRNDIYLLTNFMHTDLSKHVKHLDRVDFAIRKIKDI